ncbi:MAG: hypothetical protein HQL32_10390 [Planctomycetes bacterium]|nr:hypothetical protein [Planctomycetota bacterium]
MKHSSHKLDDFIKVFIINGDVKKNPIVVHLNQTGFDPADLAAMTCTQIHEMRKYVYQSKLPPIRVLNMIDHAFELPRGTLSMEYDAWLSSLN